MYFYLAKSQDSSSVKHQQVDEIIIKVDKINSNRWQLNISLLHLINRHVDFLAAIIMGFFPQQNSLKYVLQFLEYIFDSIQCFIIDCKMVYGFICDQVMTGIHLTIL